MIATLGTNRVDDAGKPYNDDTILELKASRWSRLLGFG